MGRQKEGAQIFTYFLLARLRWRVAGWGGLRWCLNFWGGGLRGWVEGWEVAVARSFYIIYYMIYSFTDEISIPSSNTSSSSLSRSSLSPASSSIPSNMLSVGMRRY